MIGHFRHEALNQVSVVSGFCEIIEHQIAASSKTENEKFRAVLSKIRQLAATFHSTLLVFREGCVLHDLTEEMILAAEPAGGIIQYLSPECGIQFEVLTELADALHTESKALREACPEGGKMTERCRYIASSAERLHELFLRPISYLQEVIRINRLGDAPSA